MNPHLKSQPTIFIIFGGTGDLNARKLAPALYNLYLDGWLPDQFSIIGTGRTSLTDEEFSQKILEGVNNYSRRGKVESENWNKFSAHLHYQVSDLNDFTTYSEFGKKIQAHEAEWSCVFASDLGQHIVAFVHDDRPREVVAEQHGADGGPADQH